MAGEGEGAVEAGTGSDAGGGGGAEVVVEERDVRDAISDSISEARERLESGESLLGDEDASGGEEAEVAVVPDEDDAAEGSAADEGGEAGPADEPVADGDDGDVEGEPPDAEDDLEGEGDGGEGEETEPEVVALPGRRPDDPELEIEVDDPDTAERIRQLKNMGMRGQQFRERITQVEEREAEQEFIDTELATDPAGFMLNRVAKPHRKEVLYALLADDEIYEDPEVQDHLRDWEIDPETRDEFRTKHKDERETKAKKRRARAQAQKTARTAVRDIAQNIHSIIPDGMDETSQERFYRSAMRAAEAEVMRSGKLKMSRDDLINVLDHEGLLQGYGIDPGDAAASTSGAAANGGSRRARATARSRKGEPAKERQPTAEEARSTGKRLQDESKRRRDAAAAAPAGAGAPAASIELPEGQSVKDRIKTVRKKGLAAFLGG